MVLQSSGAISFSQIQSEFGGVNPVSISEYYLNSPTGYSSTASGIPNIGTAIKTSHFFGKQKIIIVIPTPTSTNFSIPLYQWITSGGYADTSIVSGCSGSNLSRNNVSTFNNIGTLQVIFRSSANTPSAYYPNLILQAKAGDTIEFKVNVASNGQNSITGGYINLGSGYYSIGSVNSRAPLTCTFNYTIPATTPAGNYALCGWSDYNGNTGSQRTLSYYSLQIF